MTLNHLYLRVDDLDRSVEFYRRFFGVLPDSVDEARALLGHIEAAAVPVHEAYTEPAFVVFKVKDSDGYLVEVEAGVPVFSPG
jgi:catechol 2,3-dioxygenase-like lactoylglutathione lyase family enzyme